MFSQGLIGPAVLPGLQPQGAQPGTGPAQGPGKGLGQALDDAGNALSGNDFSWLLAFAGAAATGAPETGAVAQGMAPGQVPLAAAMSLRPPEAPVNLPAVRTPADAAPGMILPQTGEPLPPEPESRADVLQQTAFRATAAEPVAAQSAAGTGAIDLVTELRGQRFMPRDTQPADARSTADFDASLLLDPRSQAQASVARPQQTVITAPLPSGPADQPLFDQAVGHRLMFMIRSGSHDAKLQVQPERLGNVEIQLKLDGDEARVSLVSPHASVRDALELAVPRLRELLGDAGLALTQFDVGAGDSRSTGQSGGGAATHLGPSDPVGDTGVDDPALQGVVVLRRAEGLIDTFA